jgi:hypothetical protein
VNFLAGIFDGVAKSARSAAGVHEDPKDDAGGRKTGHLLIKK